MRLAFADLAKMVQDQPADVKAAIAKLFPDIEAKNLDLLFSLESRGFKAKPLTVEDMAKEISFVELGTSDLPTIDQLDPASLLVRWKFSSQSV